MKLPFKSIIRPIAARKTALSRIYRLIKSGPASKSASRRARPSLEWLDDRLVLTTSLAGNITQGNLYGDQSVVVASSILKKGQPTQIQVVDTGDIGMGQGSLRSFVPFKNYSGSVSMAVGDFLHKGYHQLIVGTTGKVVTQVAIFDLFQSFVNEPDAAKTGVFNNPVELQKFNPFQNFKGGASLSTGDFNADGKVELAIGAGPGGAPRVKIYEVADLNSSVALPQPRLINTFDAFNTKFKGGISLAAGHLSGAESAELIVGAGAGGGSRIYVFNGHDVYHGSSPKPEIKYQAFGTNNKLDHAPLQVQLVESIVHPEKEPVTGLNQAGLTGMFTPSNNAPLARGTILAYSSRPTTNGLVSVYSLVNGNAKQTTAKLPNISPSNNGSFRIFMTPVGYLFNKSAKSHLAPTVIVANPFQSTMSLYSLTDKNPTAISNIYTNDVNGDVSKLEYNSPSFPFGEKLTSSLPIAVKLLRSEVATDVSPGTSGMIPSRQVAFQSPFQLQFQTDTETLFSRYSNSFFLDPLNQSTDPVSEWYKTPDDPKDFYGPSLAVFGQNQNFPAISSNNQTFWQESMIAAGLQIMNRGVYYQHHHFPAWFDVPTDKDKGVGPNIEEYGLYSYTPAGMQTPGLDCSDFTALVVNMVTGQKIKEGVTTQATVKNGQTNWGTQLSGTSNIYINNDQTLGYLSWYTLAKYYEANGALKTYEMLNNTLQTGDLLYYGTIPSGSLDPTTPLTISTAAHVTIWTGQTLPIPNAPNNAGVPLLMDSHGGNIQTGVDANNNPNGVVEPAGPQIRALFVPNSSTQTSGYIPLSEFLTPDQYASQNYYYFTTFTHAIRINFPLNNQSQS